jgi:hypothetical protein
MMKRFEFQAELFGLSAAQRAATITFINNQLSGKNIRVDSVPVVREQVAHQNPPPIIIELVIEVSFGARADGDAIFDAAVSRAQSLGATNAPAPWGEPSYVRLKEVDDAARIITTRVAESPGWAESTDVISMDA